MRSRRDSVITALDVDYTKEFVLTREYLDLHSKHQLVTLAKEEKVNAFSQEELTKKSTLIDAFLKRVPKGFVPKGSVKAARVSA